MLNFHIFILPCHVTVNKITHETISFKILKISSYFDMSKYREEELALCTLLVAVSVSVMVEGVKERNRTVRTKDWFLNRTGKGA